MAMMMALIVTLMTSISMNNVDNDNDDDLIDNDNDNDPVHLVHQADLNALAQAQLAPLVNSHWRKRI